MARERVVEAAVSDGAVSRLGAATLHHADALACYEEWQAPNLILSDGAYGLGLFRGEAPTPQGLPETYAPHAAAWAKYALPGTTLWFWNSELGWATVHSTLDLHGWQYEEASIWDKGIQHIAGNVNSKTIRGVPVVTELAVRYSRKATLPGPGGVHLPLKEWLRAEWRRSGLPMHQANPACGVRNAATRKYLTECHLWYFPSGEAVAAMADWCSRHGRPLGPGEKPYFSIDGVNAPSSAAWDRLRAKWTHSHGVTNVWSEPPVNGEERVRLGSGKKALHANQKPLRLMERQVLATTDPGDIVWEPFGGLCSGSVAAVRHGRQAYAAELDTEYYEAAKARLAAELPVPALKSVA